MENAARMEAYTHALLGELQAARAGALKGRVLDTIYIGGGTPTALPAPFLCGIIEEAWRNKLTPDCEITVEMNPGSTSSLKDEVSPDNCKATSSNDNVAEYLCALHATGVNRLSIGLQAWQDELLRRVGRVHSQKDFVQTFNVARMAGFENINVDLMFSLPEQTMADWRESLTQLIKLAPEHISAYALTPAEGTPLWAWLEAGSAPAVPLGRGEGNHAAPFSLPDDETDRAMYHEAARLLNAAGYTRYEISNFCRPGRESRHNVNTWRRRSYLGVGLGAHSFDRGGAFTAGAVIDAGAPHAASMRWNNTSSMSEYLRVWGASASHNTPASISPKENITHLTKQDSMAEFMFLGLRMTDGVAEADFAAQFGHCIHEIYGTQISELVEKGLLVQNKRQVRLTRLGTDLANRVMGEFLMG
jgi:oxygen-independent coproporphyrinogen-3 oxidase